MGNAVGGGDRRLGSLRCPGAGAAGHRRTDWDEGSVAITVIVLVGDLVLLVVWRIFTLISKGMDQRDEERT